MDTFQNESRPAHTSQVDNKTTTTDAPAVSDIPQNPCDSKSTGCDNPEKSHNVNLNSEHDLYQHLIRPQKLERNLLRENKNQVAGHAGFSVMHNNPKNCLKPMNVQCLRGKREHFFYQLLEYFKRTPTVIPNGNTDTTTELCYTQTKLLVTPTNDCDCVIDSNVWREMSVFVAPFRYLVCPTEDAQDLRGDTPDSTEKLQGSSIESIYSDNRKCICYQSGFGKKMSCRRVDSEVHYLCLEDLTAHCKQPCILDVKIGKITYDPMSVREKILEQSSKYNTLHNFGFHILGMKIGSEIRDKQFFRKLETETNIHSALELFLEPLAKTSFKLMVTSSIMKRLEYILNWFETRNINQLKFFSSSLLIVYDSQISPSATIEQVSGSIRVSMIDFAHVFHFHSDNRTKSHNEKDDNSIYGLTRLTKVFNTIHQRLQYQHFEDQQHSHPPQV